MPNRLFSIFDIQDSITVINGIPNTKKLSLFSVVRNEIFLIGALLNHYRVLGIEQFLILDDGSDDGTKEFLCEQPDCVVLSSSISFGGYITVDDGNSKKRRNTGGQLKRAVGQKFFMGNYVLHVDADEFLFLPAGVSGISEIIDILEKNNIDCIAASMVDFYPSDLGELSRAPEIRSLSDLLNHYPYYDAKPVLALVEGEQARQVDDGPSPRLFRRYGISKNFGRFPKLSMALDRYLPLSHMSSARFKTPIIKWAQNTYLNGSHRANVPPSDLALLAMAHFKFNHSFEQKTEEAIVRKTHHKKSLIYTNYKRLLREMKRTGGDFLGPDSRKFESPMEFLQYGIAKWDL